MNKTLQKTLLGCLCLSSVGLGYAANKYEAEDALLDQCQLATATAASGGKYVKMQSGNLTFNIETEEAGTYDVTIFFSQTYGDTKTQNLVINGTSAGSVVFPKTASATEFSDIPCTVKFNKGENSFSITNSWGWVDIDYITVEKHSFTAFDIDKKMVTPNPIASAQELYDFLVDNFGKKTIAGVMTDKIVDVNKLEEQTEIKFIADASGKTPALVGFDFLHSTGKSSDTNTWHQSYSSSTLNLGSQLWKNGGIPAYCWHWKDPRKNDEAFYNPGSGSPSTDFDFTQAFKAGTTEWDTTSNIYKSIINDIDIVSNQLKTLQCKGVAVLWRPLHEASGGWFWWGSKGAKNYLALYHLVFDRMVKINGVRNAIWVWNSDGSDKDWYPGDEYVDIIARDFYYYPRETNHASLIGEFEKLKNVFGTKKIIALAENGSTPYPSEMFEEGAPWSYSMAWYGDYAMPTGNYDDNTGEAWDKIMNSEYNLALEDMNGWKSAAPEDCGIPDPCKSDGLTYEAECAIVNASIEKANCPSGEGVNLKNDDDNIVFEIEKEATATYKVYVGYATSYSGGKVVNCAVNNEENVAITLGTEDDEAGSYGEVLVGEYSLSQGKNIVKITPNWTWAVIDYLRLEETTATTTDELATNNIHFTFIGSTLTIMGATGNDITIIDATGRVISQVKAAEDTSIDTQLWGKGVYFAKVGSQLFKLIK